MAKEIKNLRLSGEYMTLTIDGDEKKFRNIHLPDRRWRYQNQCPFGWKQRMGYSN